MTRRLTSVLAGIVLACWQGVGVADGAPEPLPFESDSLQKILNDHAGEPFVLVLWSLRCIPCRDEMELLAEMTRRHPRFEVVLVSTDGRRLAKNVRAMVAHHGLAEAKSWVFAGPPQRLRYQIDPAWYGAMPRSYFYNTQHERVAVSGALEAEQIEVWIEQVYD